MSPAIGGPIVIGMEKSPKRDPIAWLAPLEPQRSNAIGPKRVTKQPSKRPIIQQITKRTFNQKGVL